MYRAHHSCVIIGDELYTLGGDQPSLSPWEHDSPEERQLTSSVDVYNIVNSSFTKRQTTGTPPNGTIDYSCCNIGNDIYYFGGQCKVIDILPIRDHNNLFTLNTITNDWREVITSNNDEGPMKKNGCGMIPFSINHEDYILVIGGFGRSPPHSLSHAQYTIDPSMPSGYYTNEVHIMCVSTTPGKWTVPMVTGSAFPPFYSFSINTIPGNRAIVFGGACFNENKTRYSSNNIFILSYTNNSVDFVKVAPATIDWLMERRDHSSVVISSVTVNGVKNHYLLVLGGWNNGIRITGDCFIMNIDNKKWKKISLPEVVVKRCDHSTSCYEVSVNCVWSIVTGGQDSRYEFISSPYSLMIVELVFSPTNNEWTVTNVMNEDNIMSHQILSDRLSRKRLSSTVTPSEKIMKDYEEQKQVIAKLQSDLQLCKEGYMIQLMEKEKEIKRYKVDHLQEVDQRKLSGDNTMELPIQEHSQDHIEHVETIIDHSDEGNVREKMYKQLLQENEMLRQKYDKLQLRNEELIQEMDEMRDTRDKSMKGHQLKHDQSTQFNYMTTVNDCVDNVHVGEETMYLIQGNNAQSFNWSKWGLRIHFPEDSVMADMTCEVAVKVLVGGKFHFPDGSELVSAVYGVSFANKLSKPVKLEIQHCAVLRNEHEFRRLSFVKAPVRQHVPPFEFSPLEGGVFSIDSQYGSIILDHFCLIGIILVVKNIPVGVVWKDLREVTESLNTNCTSVVNREIGSQDNTSEAGAIDVQTDSDSTVQTDSKSDDVDNVQLLYTGQLYYSRHGDGHTINQWMVRFMAVKDLNAFESYLEKKFPNAVPDQTIEFGFHGNNGVLELVMNQPQENPINGWTIRPHKNPLTIRQAKMDKFGRDDGVPSPPSCLVTVYATPGPDTTPDLYYCVPVKGMVSDTEQIFIHRILETAHTTPPERFQVSSIQGRSPHRSNEDTDVNYCEVFKDHYDSLVTAMATSCSLSNVARALRSVNLVSQSAVDFASAHRIALTEPVQCVTRLLKEVMTFLQLSKDNSKKRKAMIDFCKVLHDQDSPVLSEMASQLSDELGITY